MTSKGIYIVRLIMSSPYQIEDAEMLNEMEKKLRFKFTKAMRDKIEHVRNKYRYTGYENVVHFHGLQIVDGSHLEKVQRAARMADQELKQIHPSMSAYCVYCKIDDKQMMKGEFYRAVYYAILEQMMRDMFKQIKDLKGTQNNQLSARSRKNLKDLLDSFDEINILNDSSIEQKIQDLHQILDMPVHKAKTLILDELNYILKEMENVKFT